MSRLVALAANSVRRTGRYANSIGRPGDSDGLFAVDIRYGGTKNGRFGSALETENRAHSE